MIEKNDNPLYVSEFLTAKVSIFGNLVMFRQPKKDFARNCGAVPWSDWPALRDAIEAEYVKRTGAKEAKR